MAVELASIVCAPIVHDEHGKQYENALEECKYLWLPVLDRIFAEACRLKPIRFTHGIGVNRKDPGSKLFLDDLAVVLVVAPNTEFYGFAGDSRSTRTIQNNELRIFAREPIRMVFATKLVSHRRKNRAVQPRLATNASLIIFITKVNSVVHFIDCRIH